MSIPSFKKLFLLLLVSIFSFWVNAQQPHFIYLQTDNGQPFYVKLNNKVLSSSAEGYVILPNLIEGEYKLTVGFPKNKFPEENFALSVDQKNEGYLLKNFDEKGWQLFNLQTLALIQGSHDATLVVTDKKDVDRFSKMLANVVKDSSILQNHQSVETNSVKPSDTHTIAEKKPDIASSPATPSVTDTASVVVADSPVAGGINPLQNQQRVETNSAKPADTLTIAAKKTDVSGSLVPSTVTNTASVVVANSPETKKNSSITKVLSTQDNNGLQMIYHDKGAGSIDTILILFPADKSAVATQTDKPLNGDNVISTIPSSVDKNSLTITPTVAGGIDSASALMPVEQPEADTVQKIVPSATSQERVQEDKDSSFNKPLPVGKADTPMINEERAGKESGIVENKETAESRITVLPEKVTSSTVNSDCKAFATDEDFLKLRKKMAAESDKENMIKVAKKYFKSKCFSTEQVKDLSYLFLTDEGKYMFFDAAYAFTSDSNRYSILESQLTDDYYLNRFKAMIRK
ncbi:MAG: DUF4476 domain-containing protein [Ginsengibacter sp.]